MKEQLKYYLGTGLMIECKKHFVKYGKFHTLPLNGINFQTDGVCQMELLMPDDDLKFIEIGTKGFNPIFYPLSMLTKEIEHNGEKFVPSEFLDSDDYHTGYTEDSGFDYIIDLIY